MRDDIIMNIDPNARLDIAARPIPILQRLYAIPALRRVLVVVMLAVIWQIYASWLQNPLMVPTLSDTLQAFVTDMASGLLPQRVGVSLRVLLTGYVMGVALAAVLNGLAATSLLGNSLLDTLTSMLNPLPAIALLPLALLWFGVGEGSLLFVTHSISEALKIGSRILLLSAHPGRVRAELNDLRDIAGDPPRAKAKEAEIYALLFGTAQAREA